jgi:hypothetical protein
MQEFNGMYTDALTEKYISERLNGIEPFPPSLKSVSLQATAKLTLLTGCDGLAAVTLTFSRRLFVSATSPDDVVADSSVTRDVSNIFVSYRAIAKCNDQCFLRIFINGMFRVYGFIFSS